MLRLPDVSVQCSPLASTSSIVSVSAAVIWPQANVVTVLMGDLAFLSQVGLDLLGPSGVAASGGPLICI
jgi:hypothetical protein